MRTVTRHSAGAANLTVISVINTVDCWMITPVVIIIIYRMPRKKLRITVEYVGHISLALVGRLASCD